MARVNVLADTLAAMGPATRCSRLVLQFEATVAGKRDWSAFDRTLATARASGGDRRLVDYRVGPEIVIGTATTRRSWPAARHRSREPARHRRMPPPRERVRRFAADVAALVKTSTRTTCCPLGPSAAASAAPAVISANTMTAAAGQPVSETSGPGMIVRCTRPGAGQAAVTMSWACCGRGRRTLPGGPDCSTPAARAVGGGVVGWSGPGATRSAAARARRPSWARATPALTVLGGYGMDDGNARGGSRICVIRQHYVPQDTRVLREVTALVRDGHEVDVICVRKPGEPRRERRGRVTIRRLAVPRGAGGGPGRYLAAYAWFFLRAAGLVTVHANPLTSWSGQRVAGRAGLRRCCRACPARCCSSTCTSACPSSSPRSPHEHDIRPYRSSRRWSRRASVRDRDHPDSGCAAPRRPRRARQVSVVMDGAAEVFHPTRRPPGSDRSAHQPAPSRSATAWTRRSARSRCCVPRFRSSSCRSTATVPTGAGCAASPRASASRTGCISATASSRSTSWSGRSPRPMSGWSL